MDFIDAPRGLQADDVRDTSVRVDLLPSSEQAEGAAVWVMHPERCMESRAYNAIELGRDDELGLDQLRVSVPIARRWSQSILDDDALDEQEGIRAVLELNERIFDKCCNDYRFRAVYERFGVDPFEAVLEDSRLPAGFREKRYPQMRDKMAKLRL